jgi:hypothetical protein
MESMKSYIRDQSFCDHLKIIIFWDLSITENFLEVCIIDCLNIYIVAFYKDQFGQSTVNLC